MADLKLAFDAKVENFRTRLDQTKLYIHEKEKIDEMIRVIENWDTATSGPRKRLHYKWHYRYRVINLEEGGQKILVLTSVIEGAKKDVASTGQSNFDANNLPRVVHTEELWDVLCGVYDDFLEKPHVRDFYLAVCRKFSNITKDICSIYLEVCSSQGDGELNTKRRKSYSGSTATAVQKIDDFSMATAPSHENLPTHHITSSKSSSSRASAASKVPGSGWATIGTKSVFQMHRLKTLAIPLDKLHGACRRRLRDSCRAEEGMLSGVVLLKGGLPAHHYDTDTEPIFRQDSWFNYLFGVKESDVYGAISITTGKSVLFVPRLDEEYQIWCGEIHPPEYFKELYGVDEVHYTSGMCDWLTKALSDAAVIDTVEGGDKSGGGVDSSGKLFLLEGVNTDSGLSAQPATFDGSAAFTAVIDTTQLFPVLSRCRVIKTKEEVEVMWYASYVASMAHVEVMLSTCAGMMEYELEARFLYEIYRRGGCRNSAYTSICACGPNSAVLHYGHAGAPNSRMLEENDMALLDMGADYHGYMSDITCSFPVNSLGKFTADQRAVYEGVLAAQTAVLRMVRPGVAWSDCHLAAEREIVIALASIGILAGGSIDSYVSACLGPVFFPHGLGHLIGCDTHDVGGYSPDVPQRSDRPGLRKLRTARILEEGMVLTNEPGLYFIDYLLDEALKDGKKSRFIDTAVLYRFRGFGGVRLEDVIVVTASGVDNLTTCPRTVNEVESVLAAGKAAREVLGAGVVAGSIWPPSVDAAPELRRRWGRLAEGGLGMQSLKLATLTSSSSLQKRKEPRRGAGGTTKLSEQSIQQQLSIAVPGMASVDESENISSHNKKRK